MTNYTDACDVIKQYPNWLTSHLKSDKATAEASEDKAEGDDSSSSQRQAKLKEAATAYKEHLTTHTEIKNYARDAPILIEALAGCFLKELKPIYNQTDANELTQMMNMLEETCCALLQCLAELCVDRESEEADENQISADCRARRDLVKKALPASLLSQIAESMIRKGISARSDAIRCDCVNHCAILTRRLGTLHDESWLKIARITCECVEAPSVRRNGVIALGVMSKAKLELGKATTALVITHELTLCVSSLMDILASEEDSAEEMETTNMMMTQSSTIFTMAQYSLSAMLQLLQDPDRQDPVSWTTWLAQLLDDRFRSGADEESLHGGLCFLNLLYNSATEEFVAYSTAAVLPLRILPIVMKSEHRSLRIRTEASNFLTNCTDWPVLREMLTKADCIDLLSPLVLEEVRVDDLELQAAVLAVLARLMLHNADVRELLTDTIPFWPLLTKLASAISERESNRNKRIASHLVQVLSALSFHQEFKAHVLNQPMARIVELEKEFEEYVKSQPEERHISLDGGDGGTREHPLIQPGSKLDSLISQLLTETTTRDNETLASDVFSVLRKLSVLSEGGPASFHIVLSIFNLVRSSQDKRLLRKTKNGPDFDDQQLKELEMMYEKLPENAKLKERLQYISGGLILTSAVRKLILQDKTLLPLLIKLGTKPSGVRRISGGGSRPGGGRLGGGGGGGGGVVSNSLVSMSAQAVRYMASLIELRPVLVSQGGLSVLSKALELDPDDKHSRFALVSIVATVRPESHRYETRMSCAHQALRMIDSASEELYVHIAARSLVNLTSSFDDVSLKVFDGGKGWRRMESILTDWSDATSAYGAEIMCNITAKDEVNMKIAELIHENRMPWTFTLIFAYAGDDSCKPRQLACLAILSYLTQITQTAQWIMSGSCQLQYRDTHVHAAEKILELWLSAAGSSDSSDALARLSVTVMNLLLTSLPNSNEDVQTLCQKLVLSVGLVWTNIDDRARNTISSMVKTIESDSRAKLQKLAQIAPSQHIQDIWAKLLEK